MFNKENDKTDFIECPSCKKKLDKAKVIRKKYICYECGYYFRVRCSNRIRMVADSKSFKPWFEEVSQANPLNFEGYEDKLRSVREKTGLSEAVTIGECTIYGERAVLGICDARFLMGSMGAVVGERIAAAFERATEEKLPVFIFCASGGARMQEGIISLMQMAKTAAAIKRHSEAGLFYASILTDPTTGGVTASFAMLGDVIMAEPGALVGFAGPRVIAQTIGQELPEGFQRAEFIRDHGFTDGIVERADLRKTMYFLLITNRKAGDRFDTCFHTEEQRRFVYTEILKEAQWKARPLSAWEKVKCVRQAVRPSALDYMGSIFDYFVEAHGDRAYGDDQAIMGGIALLDGQPVTVIADMKGRTLEECKRRNFGMPLPEGYRKALRLMKEAEKFGRPIVSFVNTAGAYCGIEAEERGQGEAIARNLYEMSALKVPVICIMIGEGGSGGALATAVGNQVWMLENATYSILSPEGFASILWKDAALAPKASESMNITAQDLLRLGVIEEIIPEFGQANADNAAKIGDYMRDKITGYLKEVQGKPYADFASERYDRFRRY